MVKITRIRKVKLVHTAGNGAVWHERRCSPQKPLCDFAGFSPARASVSRLPRQAATTKDAHSLNCQVTICLQRHMFFMYYCRRIVKFILKSGKFPEKLFFLKIILYFYMSKPLIWKKNSCTDVSSLPKKDWEM